MNNTESLTVRTGYKRKKILSVVGVNVIAWVVSLISLVPLLLLLFNSMKDSKAASDMTLALPTKIEWSNYATVIEKGKLDIAFMNSLIYSVGSVLLTTFVSALAAYVLSRSRTRFHNALYFFIALGITMPTNFVALMKVMQFFHLTNTRIGLILLYAALQIPFNVFLIYPFVKKIPRDIDEAGVLDGCTPFMLFIRLMLPLLKPVLITVMVLTFLNTWNEFIMPLYFLGETSKWPMTLAVYNFFGMYFKDWNLVSADIVLTSLPVIIVYLLGQKYIVSGMTSGAVKG